MSKRKRTPKNELDHVTIYSVFWTGPGYYDKNTKNFLDEKKATELRDKLLKELPDHFDTPGYENFKTNLYLSTIKDYFVLDRKTGTVYRPDPYMKIEK